MLDAQQFIIYIKVQVVLAEECAAHHDLVTVLDFCTKTVRIGVFSEKIL
jgi:hypothetical protein